MIHHSVNIFGLECILYGGDRYGLPYCIGVQKPNNSYFFVPKTISKEKIGQTPVDIAGKQFLAQVWIYDINRVPSFDMFVIEASSAAKQVLICYGLL